MLDQKTCSEGRLEGLDPCISRIEVNVWLSIVRLVLSIGLFRLSIPTKESHQSRFWPPFPFSPWWSEACYWAPTKREVRMIKSEWFASLIA